MRRLRATFWVLLVGPLLYWFGPTLIAHALRTFDPFTFSDDARILVWPFFRDSDPSLFAGDPFAAYFLSGLPEGYRAVYHLAGTLGVAARTSEVLPYFLLLVTLAFVAVTAYRLGGKPGAFIASVLLLGSASVLDRLGGGLPRAFAFPIVAMGGYALVMGYSRWLAVLCVLGAAFYPVVAALLGLALFFLWVLPSQLRGERVALSLRDRFFWLLGTLALVVALLAPTALRLRSYGATITEKTLALYPEAGPGGRLGPEQQSPFPPWYVSAGFHAKQGLLGTGELIGGKLTRTLRSSERATNALVFGGLAAASLLIALRAIRQRSLAPELIRLLCLGAAFIVGYIAASWVTPNLFLPERYAQYTVPLLAILIVATGFGKPPTRIATAEHAVGATEKVHDWRSLARRGKAWAGALVVTLLLGGRGTSWTGIEIWCPPEERVIYSEVGKLPVASIIAGWPLGPLENIPYLSKRRVLTNYQLEMPFHQGFTESSRERVKSLFEAYYAEDTGPLRRLVSKFGVTHLLVEPRYFGPTMPTYYRPYDELVWRLYRRAQGAHPVLDWALDKRVSRRLGAAYLIDVNRLLTLTADAPTGRKLEQLGHE